MQHAVHPGQIQYLARQRGSFQPRQHRLRLRQFREDAMAQVGGLHAAPRVQPHLVRQQTLHRAADQGAALPVQAILLVGNRQAKLHHTFVYRRITHLQTVSGAHFRPDRAGAICMR